MGTVAGVIHMILDLYTMYQYIRYVHIICTCGAGGSIITLVSGAAHSFDNNYVIPQGNFYDS